MAETADQSLRLFKVDAHPLYEVPVAPFGDKTLHVAFFKEEACVQLDGEFTIDQLRALVSELERRKAA